MANTARRAALYVRVSTDRQTARNQIAEVRQLAVARGYEPGVYEEVESAAKARPVLDRMLADVRAGRVQAVAVWALDRLHRSMTGAINTVLELDRLGVPVLSVLERWFDTSGPVRPLLVAIFGWMAEQERTRLIERTRAGVERARRQGSGWGVHRPRRCSCTPPGTSLRAASPWPMLLVRKGFPAPRCSVSSRRTRQTSGSSHRPQRGVSEQR